jgi:hypothetical protein
MTKTAAVERRATTRQARPIKDGSIGQRASHCIPASFPQPTEWGCFVFSELSGFSVSWEQLMELL